ncbi:Dus-domain-containing protein [Coemansia reversa NRRL 1564]|uniref:tRNA-dihydrouridine(16/17) synthase [NAD(P)(+)] n=1 Tax=Coemansia reversa (strain ATCC 12441 / NRRL 1564) TaxID=763665 RepID=A0A2G5BB10_COERN|nr:Dus-domain-containing protein [Coemansia reversa NRRL 1564]|eukprot:PIA16191.1 Dus-domain-containing protein [Coemansia reversa NRRL 1564]
MTIPVKTLAAIPEHFTMTEDEIRSKFPTRLCGYDLYRKIGSPKLVVAPMVDQSELAWRILSRRYNAQLCYTPMINAKLFYQANKGYIKEQWQTNDNDRPVIVQFCANDPDMLLNAAKLVVEGADAVDLNLGCPQNIAKRGHYGSYLMEDWDLISKLIRKLHENLEIPVTAKIRVYPDVEKTVEYAKMVEAAGAQMITVHGRLRDQRGHKTGLADWAKIRAVKEAVNVPVFANGNILYYEDIQRCIEETGVDGVMSAETNLYNPALFSGKILPTWKLATEYMEICQQVPTKFSYIRGHLFKLFRNSLPVHTDLRQQLVAAETLEDYDQFTKDIETRLIEEANVSSFDPDHIEKDEHGYRKYPHWICQPALRFEHDKQRSHTKRLLNEAEADKQKNNNTINENTDSKRLKSTAI